MSGAANNYNLSRLNAGIALAASSFLLSVLALVSRGGNIYVEGTPTLIVSVLYGCMMFASSYVEEEQHFWYWLTSGWLAWLHEAS
jgi:ethanolamine phosphate transferase 2 subunit G